MKYYNIEKLMKKNKPITFIFLEANQKRKIAHELNDIADIIYNKYGTHPAYFENDKVIGTYAKDDCAILEKISFLWKVLNE